MGNHKFRLSDMMPNAWFYKLKDMGKPRNQNSAHQKKKKKQTTLPSSNSPSSSSYASSQSSFSTTTTTLSSKPNQTHHHQHRPRKSYYFTRELNSHTNDTKSPENLNNFPEQPRKSPKQRPIARKRRPAKPSSHKLLRNNCKTTPDDVWTTTANKPKSSPELSSSPEREYPVAVTGADADDPEFRCDRILATQACGCREKWEENDIVIDVDKASLSKRPDFADGFDSFSVVELPPIITKPSKLKKKKLESSISQKASPPVRKLSSNSPGIRLRMNSPRIISSKRVVSSHGRRSLSSFSSSSEKRRSLSESFAIVKSSFDPQRDFRESMVEMIVENNIRASKDLEDLLACYLSLNSDEYHDLIINVFKQIWFDLTDISSK